MYDPVILQADNKENVVFLYFTIVGSHKVEMEAILTELNLCPHITEYMVECF